VNQFIQLTMMAVMGGLCKSVMLQTSGSRLVTDLRDSIVEETTAATVYRKRGDYARSMGDNQLADMYEHIEREEEHHRLELLGALKRIQKTSK